MNIKKAIDLDNAFKSEDTLMNVFDILETELNIIDSYKEISRQYLLDNPVEIEQGATKLVSAYYDIHVAFKLAETYEESIEATKYSELYTDCIKDKGGVKGTENDQFKKESKLARLAYSRVRSILSGYVSGCEKHITLFQSLLKYIPAKAQMLK